MYQIMHCLCIIIHRNRRMFDNITIDTIPNQNERNINITTFNRFIIPYKQE